MSTITHSTGIIQPVLVDGYQSSRDGGTLTHRILGRRGDDITLRPAKMRTGSLRLNFGEDEAAAAAAEIALCKPEVFTFAVDERSTLGMTFVVPDDRQITRDLDDQTRDVWIVSVPFQEIEP